MNRQRLEETWDLNAYCFDHTGTDQQTEEEGEKEEE